MSINLSSNNNTNASHISSSFKAKLRRLKIEETILLQSVNNGNSKKDDINIGVDSVNYLIQTEFRKFSDDMKSSFNALKQLFLDIKASTHSSEVIKSIDIDDIKKDTLDLENKLKTFKMYLQSQLTALKPAERQLNQQLKDPMSIKHSGRKSTGPTVKYTEIVPSPVKTLMTSPLKSSEVHDFQEFMRTSKNRYGGWDEYHHNIFINMWQKHFDTSEHCDIAIEKPTEFNLFLRALLPKLIGINEDEVILHERWYNKYLHLKDRQQKAIDKWRSNKRKMKASNVEKKQERDSISRKSILTKKHIGPSHDYLPESDDLIDNLSLDKKGTKFSITFTRKCVYDEMQNELTQNKASICNEEYAEMNEQKQLRFLQTTKQRNIRCGTKDIKRENDTNIENIKKLGTPLWRAGL